MQIMCTLLQTDNHTSTSPLSFLQARCPPCHPTNIIKALKAQSVYLEYKIKSIWTQFSSYGGSFHYSTNSSTFSTTPHTTTVYSPFSGTTRVSRCQNRTSGLYGAKED